MDGAAAVILVLQTSDSMCIIYFFLIVATVITVWLLSEMFQQGAWHFFYFTLSQFTEHHLLLA